MISDDNTEVILEIEDEYTQGSGRNSWSYTTHQGGRPSSKGEAAKRWRDEETIELIRLWQEHDVLYNNKNTLFHSKEEREKAVHLIQDELTEKKIIATFEQIWDKITNLKCYYGSQKREIDYKRSKEFKDYESPWKFYSYLSFLDEHLIQRKKRDAYIIHNNTAENMARSTKTKKLKYGDDILQYDSRSTVSPSMVHTYSSQNETYNWSESQPPPPSQPPSQPQAQPQQPQPQIAIPPVTSPQTISSTTCSTTMSTEQSKSEDATFCELMCKMLNQIPESEEKAMLKIELQQRVIACRYKSQQ